MNLTLKIWRQKDAKSQGKFETYKVENISPDSSFLEMLDILNNDLIMAGKVACHGIVVRVAIERGWRGKIHRTDEVELCAKEDA